MDAGTKTMGVPPPSKLAHVVLRTTNKDKMAAFYKTLLGAHAVYENEMFSFLSYDDEHHRVAIIALPGTTPRPPSAAGMDHVAFTFRDLRELLAAYAARKRAGITPWWCVNHGPTVSMYYVDPDGNKVETQVDVFATMDEATAFMMSPQFAENPLGVDFDPEDMIRRLGAGEDEAELMRRADIGPRGPETLPPMTLAGV